MASKKIIAVIGATGTQGGGVARDLLKDGEFAVRAVTRNPDSASAKELAKLGAEVVKADVADTASLTKAFQGAYGVFGITDFWSLFFKNNFNQAQTEAEETQLGKNLVDAAKATGIQHFVWSTLDNIEGIHVYHFVSKYNVNAYLEASGVPFTLFYTSFYYSNLIMPGFELLKKNEDGSFTLNIPAPADVKIHSFDGADVGRWVVPAFKNRSKYAGQNLYAVAEFISAREYAEILNRATGKSIKLAEVTKEKFYTDEYRQAVGDELWLNMDAWVKGVFKRDLKLSYAVAPDPTTLEKWVKTNPQIRAYLGL